MTRQVVSRRAAVIIVGKRRHESSGPPPRLKQHERFACAFQISEGFCVFFLVSKLISKHLFSLFSGIEFFSHLI